jgi:Lar family restriction alleviation protein
MKSCPFCGSNDVRLDDADQMEASSWIAGVVCNACDARVEPGYGAPSEAEALAEATELWNRRATPGGDAKPSTCCPGSLLVPFHSTDTKMCTGCKTERHWPLEPGQKRTFD